MEKKKVGIIRCLQTEAVCSGGACFKFAKEGKGQFEPYGPVEVVAWSTCGGCPGKNIIPRAEMMIKKGAEAIALSSCIIKGTPIGFPCPFKGQIISSLRKRIGQDIPIIEGTH